MSSHFGATGKAGNGKQDWSGSDESSLVSALVKVAALVNTLQEGKAC